MSSGDVELSEELKRLQDEITQLAISLAAQQEAATEAWLKQKRMRSNFIEELDHEKSDWAFILKVAATLEALITDWLSFLLSGNTKPGIAFRNDGILVPPLQREGSDGRQRNNKKIAVRKNSPLGHKISLSEYLELFEPHTIAWMRALNEFRNRYAHRIEYIDYSFGQVLRTFRHEFALDIGDAIHNRHLTLEERQRDVMDGGGDLSQATMNSLSWRRKLPRVMHSFTFTTLARCLEGVKEPYQSYDFIYRHDFSFPLGQLLTTLHLSTKPDTAKRHDSQ